MSKITRYNGNVKAFASEATGTERTIFGDTAQSDSLDANITLELLRGWGVIGVESNPTKQHFNGLGFTLGQLISYLHQRGIAEWNAAQEYYAGSVVTTLAGIYRLKSGGVGSYDPDTEGGVNWELIPTQTKVDAKADQATTYTETEVNNLLNGKADKVTTYTETEVDDLLDDKADKATTYTETEVDGLLNAKADKATTYTKTEAAVDFGSTTDDLDTVVKSGFYRIENNANLPPGADSGQLIVSRGGDTILQIVSDFGGRLWQRSGNPSNVGGPGSYSDWQEISAQGIGVGQTWQDVSRLSDVTYTNNTGKPIAISGYYFQAVGGDKVIQIIVGSVTVARADSGDVNDNQVFAIIPSGNTYVVSVSGATGYWRELR